MLKKSTLLALLFLYIHFAYPSLNAEIPQWMASQIEADLSPFRNKPISIQKLLDFYYSDAPFLVLMKVTIANNRVFVEKNKSSLDERLNAFEQALHRVCKIGPLPDAILLISLEDGFFWDYSHGEIPIFVQSKEKGQCAILLPDFEALQSAYQVLPGKDLTSYAPKWKSKKSRLIWRGSTAQHGWRIALTQENLPYFSRVTLCRLSQLYPSLIDAKFTIFAQGGESILALQAYRGNWIPYEKQVEYKYHILIDGNVSSYTCSGWRFFINSLVFKPDSPWVQWYYAAMQPYVHYVPVEANLSDLPQKIQWAIDHDKKAKKMAKNAREFALTHITLDHSLKYLYHLIWEYSRLDFVDE